MKLLFIIFNGLGNSSSGIGKKILNQLKALKSVGFNASISYLSTDIKGQYNGRLINNQLMEEYITKFGINKRFHWRFKFKKLFEFIKNENINVVYLRYTHFANLFFIRFLKKIKKLGIYIVMEIPTYPYDAEYKNAKTIVKIAKKIEVIHRKSFRKYIDKMITFSDAEEIFGVKTIKVNNGIDLDSIPLKKIVYHKNEIHLIAVASMEFWHGYDRIIEGLGKYYSNNPVKKVYLNLVGNPESEESIKYKKLVQNYNLDKIVFFHGLKIGEELDKLFDISDLAIGCLGVHRKGITHLKSLKNSEYCARGIPFVYSEIDDSFEGKHFILKIPADDRPVDISNLVEFCDSGTFNSTEIRQFAKENLTWKKQMERIFMELPNHIKTQL